MRAVETVETLTARRDGTDDDTLADGIELAETGAQFFDDANRLVPENQAGPHRVLTPDDVDVRPADGGKCDPDHSLAGTGHRTWDLLDGDAILGVKYDGFHGFHCGLETLCRWSRIVFQRD